MGRAQAGKDSRFVRAAGVMRNSCAVGWLAL